LLGLLDKFIVSEKAEKSSMWFFERYNYFINCNGKKLQWWNYL